MLQKMELFRAEPDKPIILWADASNNAIGAVLKQKHPEGTGPYGTVPVGFFLSRQLSKQANPYPYLQDPTSALPFFFKCTKTVHN